MATVDELARDVLASIDTDVNAIAAAKWIDNRYKEMVAKVKFRHLRKVGELLLNAVYNTGTAAVDRGSTTVTGYDDADGDSTEWATTPSTSPYEFWFFRARSAWYNVSTVTDDDTLDLATAFAEDDVDYDATTGLGGAYNLVRRYYPLASDARWFGDFYMTRLRRTLALISLTEMDILHPGRTLVGSIPSHVCQIGIDATNSYPMVEIYPPPTNTEIIHYVYSALPTTLSISSTIPPVIDAYTLKAGVLIDLYRHEKARALRKGNVEAAAVWRNDEMVQNAKWDLAIKDAIRTSRGADDITLILEMFRGVPMGRGEQRTAHDYINDNWDWSR